MSLFQWNDHIDTERLAAQTEELLEGGMGGVLLQPGHGLPPGTYLAEEWLAAVTAAARRARKRRDSIWICEDLDNDATAVLVHELLDERPDLSQTRLVLRDFEADEIENTKSLLQDSVAAFRVTRSSPLKGVAYEGKRRRVLVEDAISFEPIEQNADWEALRGSRLLSFHVAQHKDRLNFLNAEALGLFLDRTHQRYYDNVKRYFGNTLGLCFVCGARMSPGPGAIPWDPELPTLFKETRGHSLLDMLPALFFDVDGCEAYRYDYWTLVADMFREGFAYPFRQWTEQRRIPSAGHTVGASTIAQAIAAAGSRSALYEHLDYPSLNIPEIDVYTLRRDRETYLRQIVAIKEAVSVQRQLAKGGVVNESLDPGDKRQTVERLRNVAHFQAALGLQFMTHHASRSSLRADRKLDASPLIGPQQPYWRFLSKSMDAQSRISWLLSQGTSTCEVLVLHPATSIQAAYRHPRTREEEEIAAHGGSGDLTYQHIERHFASLSSALLDAQIDHDYADEIILARHGRTHHRSFSVGQQEYRVVILPPMLNLNTETLNLLHDFAMGGGAVLAVGTVATLMDGRPSDDARDFVREYAQRIRSGIDLFDYSAVVQRLTELDARSITAKNPAGNDLPSLKVHRRRWENLDIILISNAGEAFEEAEVAFEAPVTGHVETWDPDTGKMHWAAECRAKEPVRLSLQWDPGQAKILMVMPGEEKSVEPPKRYGNIFKRIAPEWFASRPDANALPLCKCRVIDDGETGDWTTLAEARQILGTRIDAAGGPAPLRLQWQLNAATDRPLDGLNIEAALELSQGASITFNGNELTMEALEKFLDPAISTVPLGEPRQGENTLEIWQMYAEPTDLQPPWILGGFAVTRQDSGAHAIGSAEGPLALGDWQELGMPFYAGSVVYRADVQGYEVYGGDRVTLELPGLAGTAELRINGTVVDHVLWAPYIVDITEFWKAGELNFELEVASDLNCLMEAPETPRQFGLLYPPEIVITSPLPEPVVTDDDEEAEEP